MAAATEAELEYAGPRWNRWERKTCPEDPEDRRLGLELGRVNAERLGRGSGAPPPAPVPPPVPSGPGPLVVLAVGIGLLVAALVLSLTWGGG